MSYACNHGLTQMFRRYNARDTSDGDLLRAFRTTGDQEAFAELMQRHGGMVTNAARAVIGDMSEAEDIAQGTFLTLARKARSLDGMGSLGGWLYHVAVCLARNLRQQKQRRMAREREAAMIDVPTEEASAIPDATIAALHEALADLSETYRAPVILHHLEGKSYKQAAMQLGCTAKTFSSRASVATSRRHTGHTYPFQKQTANRGRHHVPRGMGRRRRIFRVHV